MGNDRKIRLIHAFVTLIPDHRQDYASFVRDIENVRYCSAPLDQHQLARCEYALRNMEMLLLAMHDALHVGEYEGEKKEFLIETKNGWQNEMARAQALMGEIHHIVDKVDEALDGLRSSVGQGVR